MKHSNATSDKILHQCDRKRINNTIHTYIHNNDGDDKNDYLLPKKKELTIFNINDVQIGR